MERNPPRNILHSFLAGVLAQEINSTAGSNGVVNLLSQTDYLSPMCSYSLSILRIPHYHSDRAADFSNEDIIQERCLSLSIGIFSSEAGL